ncbi:MAG: bifunctional diaminohydroxyphosphoribosylaminopyrimidine deaminase/5-amino-6-(5-phosphoribosylamino)uracil reductase RibD [Thiothrix sp.]|nr:bifunctional diaminohydroxyphosphoribosylaminopyrimidine deaminase/5-amino-6-(5-phosphoribosylamino)uracil reductase RibD [Thiothrix sp.]HPQ95814.1 bifunctional diaminohydroxyphosphoribosylaminopyrimidine deaminase/5-amino-6-(5-phosphoribosylamino)uracil reductase RibD [Thiolinea sp.]
MSEQAFSAADTAFMARALQLARCGLYTTQPNPRVGCVLVRAGEIIGSGFHARAGQAHAEINALHAAGDARGADAYVTLEPCSHFGRTPPCADALIRAGVQRVVVAMRDPNPLVAGQGLARLEAAGIRVQSGLLEAPARALNPGFVARMERGRPWVRLKLAMSLDGRTAMASGESVWITGAPARRDVQFWRARADAVLTGIGTVLADDPALNVRLGPEALGISGPVRQPLRVILDSRLQLAPDARLLQLPGLVQVFTCSSTDEHRIQALEAGGVVIRQLAGPQPALETVLQQLGRDGINEVHVEAGPTLAGALLAQGLADELLIYMAPHLMGALARPLFGLPLERMEERVGLAIQDIRAVGEDWRILARVTPADH